MDGQQRLNMLHFKAHSACGPVTFSYTGSGASAFLTRIDDVANEGGAKKNWQLWVNTSYADKSFGVYEVQPLDVVFWRFTTQAGK